MNTQKKPPFLTPRQTLIHFLSQSSTFTRWLVCILFGLANGVIAHNLSQSLWLFWGIFVISTLGGKYVLRHLRGRFSDFEPSHVPTYQFVTQWALIDLLLMGYILAVIPWRHVNSLLPVPLEFRPLVLVLIVSFVLWLSGYTNGKRYHEYHRGRSQKE